MQCLWGASDALDLELQMTWEAPLEEQLVLLMAESFLQFQNIIVLDAALNLGYILRILSETARRKYKYMWVSMTDYCGLFAHSHEGGS